MCAKATRVTFGKARRKEARRRRRVNGTERRKAKRDVTALLMEAIAEGAAAAQAGADRAGDPRPHRAARGPTLGQGVTIMEKPMDPTGRTAGVGNHDGVIR